MSISSLLLFIFFSSSSFFFDLSSFQPRLVLTIILFLHLHAFIIINSGTVQISSQYHVCETWVILSLYPTGLRKIFPRHQLFFLMVRWCNNENIQINSPVPASHGRQKSQSSLALFSLALFCLISWETTRKSLCVPTPTFFPFNWKLFISQLSARFLAWTVNTYLLSFSFSFFCILYFVRGKFC